MKSMKFFFGYLCALHMGKGCIIPDKKSKGQEFTKDKKKNNKLIFSKE